ncbi:hypothetical protein [Teredinibacter sp. KSP-S5-2]|uniref:hypothetical protein n=1 Tax=Teredinibacter sp. KSP-S5-2 TaxID=3034506 RepID=UPI00293468D3|nr:hypothetical protein [Teredinibacter sp. KSP-S5-2]WNO10307.1 hypothetical protein P5V12_03885 [Teredinibacter sp. KSP-S5-2]
MSKGKLTKFLPFVLLVITGCANAGKPCANNILDEKSVVCVSEYARNSKNDLKTVYPIVERGIKSSVSCDRWDWLNLTYRMSKVQPYKLNYPLIEEYAESGVRFAMYLMAAREVKGLAESELKSLVYWSLLISIGKPQNNPHMENVASIRMMAMNELSKESIAKVIQRVVKGYPYRKDDPCL